MDGAKLGADPAVEFDEFADSVFVATSQNDSVDPNVSLDDNISSFEAQSGRTLPLHSGKTVNLNLKVSGCTYM